MPELSTIDVNLFKNVDVQEVHSLDRLHEHDDPVLEVHQLRHHPVERLELGTCPLTNVSTRALGQLQR